MGREMGGRFKREGIYVYLWLIHAEVWQKTAKFCKAIILQLKNELIKKHFILFSLPFCIEEYQRKGEIETKQGPVGPSWVQKPLGSCLSCFLFVEKGFGLRSPP